MVEDHIHLSYRGGGMRENEPNPFVLVVDDEPDIRYLVGALLQSEGYQTKLADSGSKALDFVAEEKPDAIVLNLSLPDIDGIAVLHRIKQNVETADIPIVIMSAYTGRLSKKDRALSYAVFEKPFDLDEFVKTIGRSVTPSTTA